MEDQVIDRWLNVGAVSACVGLVIWMMTRGLPGLIERFISETSKQREDYKEELKSQRDESRRDATEQRDMFRDEMVHQREMTKTLVSEGHTAIQSVSRSVDLLREEIHGHFQAFKGGDDAN